MTILLRMDLTHLVGQLLSERGLTLAVAESCTGGLVGHRVTDVPGSSAYFLGGVISYSNEAKQQLLGVAAETLVAHGAVSAETAAQMAAGARRVFGADVALSITGIAGPGGGTPEKPVGLTYVGLAHPGGVRVEHFVWKGTREENKARSAEAAFALLHRHLQQDERGEEDGDPA